MNRRRQSYLRVPRTALSVLLAFLLAWGSVPVPALAEAAIELEGNASAETEGAEGLVGGQDSQGSGFVEVQDEDSGVSNDELLESYIQRQFDMQLPGSADDIDVATQSAGDYLSDAEFTVYDMLRKTVQQIACGEEASTVIELPLSVILSKTEWTFAELGVANPKQNNKLTDEALDAIGAKWSEESWPIIRKALQAVCADCPYDMYWYGRGYKTSYSYYYSDQGFTFADASLSLEVAPNYSAGDCTVNTSLAQSVQTAVTRATNIANAHKNEATSVRLASYKQEICKLVEYNDAASHAGGIAGFGSNSPWELVWVFDGDKNTNVVCEGYSKAFKYLCDLSGKTDVECLTVTGLMGDVLNTSEMGGHMWNVVRMPDDKSYLVDVTNCDEGSAGNPDYLFLKGYAEGGYANNYFGFTTHSVTGKDYYIYYNETKSTYSQADLNLSSTDYDPAYDITEEKQSISPVVTIQGWTYGQAANAPQLTAGSNPGNGVVTYEYKVAGAGDGTYATKVPTSAGSYTVRATVDETDAYLSGTATADFTIAKATPSLGTVAAAAVVDDLDASKVVLSRTNTSVAGTLSLVEKTLQYGTNTYHWTFTPSDTVNYNTCDGTVSITVSGHDWGDAEYVWSANKSSVTATRVCNNNSAHKETETVNTTSTVTTAATCTKPGVRTYTATFSNAAFTKQTKQVTIPATGHAWGDWHETTPPTATQKGEETRECSKCHTTETRDIDPLGQTDISGATVTLSARSFTYDGTERRPSVVVSLNGKNLGAADFTVSYQRDGASTSDLKNAGTVTVVATGKVDYKGTASTTFTISPLSIADGAVTVSQIASQTATGNELTPEPTVSFNGTALVKGTDYTLGYSGNVDPGTATVTITGKGNFTGTRTVAFQIVEPEPQLIDISSATIEVEKTVFTYNGNEIEPDVTVSLNGTELDWLLDYDVTYQNNVNAGTATVVVTGCGDYTGTASKTFTIAKAEQDIELIEDDFEVTYGDEAFRLYVIRWEGDGAISYKSSDATVVTVSATGVVTIVGAGTATITVTAAGTKNYNEAKITANVTVARAANPIKASAKKATVTTTYNPAASVVTGCNVTVSNAVGAVTYKNASTDATANTFQVIKTSGKVTVPKATPAGTYTVKVKATAAGDSNYKAGSKTISYKIVVAKAANPMTVKAVTRTASFSTLKKKAVVVERPVTVSNAQGKVTYIKVDGSDALTIHKTSGKVTVKKGTKKGTYSIKIKVTDPGSTNYNKGAKTVTAKVVVK